MIRLIIPSLTADRRKVFTTRAPCALSFRAIKDLAISHCIVGRKNRSQLLAVGHHASWHPKKPIMKSGENREKAQRDSVKVYGFPRKYPESFRFPLLLFSNSSPPRAGLEILTCSKREGLWYRVEWVLAYKCEPKTLSPLTK